MAGLWITQCAKYEERLGKGDGDRAEDMLSRYRNDERNMGWWKMGRADMNDEDG